MANVNNPNSFRLISSLYGHSELVKGNVYHASAIAIATGDAIIEDDTTAGKVNIAVFDSDLLHGIAAQPIARTAGQVTAPFLYYPALPGNVFEGQCSGTYALTKRYFACDIEGATGIMEVNENLTNEDVIYIIREDPNTEIGAYSRVQFLIIRSSFYPVLAAK